MEVRWTHMKPFSQTRNLNEFRFNYYAYFMSIFLLICLIPLWLLGAKHLLLLMLARCSWNRNKRSTQFYTRYTALMNWYDIKIWVLFYLQFQMNWQQLNGEAEIILNERKLAFPSSIPFRSTAIDIIYVICI